MTVRRRAAACLVLAMVAAGGLPAQTSVRAPGGVLSGVVRDSTTGRPVGYALVLVVGKEQRVFASESGRFTLTGLGAGTVSLRLQQIGFRGITLTLRVDTSSVSGGGGSGLDVRLTRRPMILPEVVVTGDVCSGTAELAADGPGESIIDEALKNAERLLALEKSYPFKLVFQQQSVQLDTGLRQVGQRTDTLRYDTRGILGYRRGRVVQGRRGPREVANYFTTSDLARESFQESHCFWYSGRDTTNDGSPAHRIEFAPVAKTKTPDWAGSLLIDPATMMLVRSEARLVNLRSRETTFLSARCLVLYREIVPTLVTESTAACNTSRESKTTPHTIGQWRLIDFSFVGKSPLAPAPP